MKTLFSKSSKLRRLPLAATALAIAAAAALTLPASPAAADIVAQGRIGGADIRVRLQTPDRVVVHERDPRIVVRHVEPAPIVWRNLSREDHRVAARLSLLSGVRERLLLADRSHGLSWKRIARIYDIDRGTLRLARSYQPLRQISHICHDGCCDRGGYDDHGRGHGGWGKGGKRGKGGRR